MPFAVDEVRYDLTCGPDADGRPRGWFTVYVRADALRGLGLHPGQPTARGGGFSPPAWWHAAGERYGRRWSAPPPPE
ncbi:hypothetical protein [Streptomyces sp. NBC_01451]|uniref:hypothetical protein n=1 Tax=Streptomyces sp. NBC_01451 TaxID=2903872 RepID=UPI002E36C0C6|nr:hypothetical protein [Streptomyces sp. NBC_01451]